MEAKFNEYLVKPVKTENVSPVFMNSKSTSNSAFKPIDLQDSKDISPNSSKSHSTDSQSSKVQSAQQKPMQAAASNPFYIDKIFNFQNMFLFANAGAHHAPNATAQPTAHGTENPSNEMHLIQQNLLQNFYNYYYSNPTSLLAANNNNGSLNENKNKLYNMPSSEKPAAPRKTNFSIDSILASTSNPSIINNNNSKNEPKTPVAATANKPAPNFDYLSLFAHQYYLSSLQNSVNNYTTESSPMSLFNRGINFQSSPILPPQQVHQPVVNVHEMSMLSDSNPLKRSASRANLGTPVYHASNARFAANVLANSSNGAKQARRTIETTTMPLIKTDNSLVPQHQQQQPVVKSKNAKKYKCDLCGRGFSRSNTLITHRRIHTGEKPFECNICGRAFRQPGNLTRHKLTHTTIKPYSCNKCGKSFNRVSNLHAHIKVHSDGKPFVCIVCGSGFYQKIDLKIHALTHSSSNKHHECNICKKVFKQAAHLKYHLHTHYNKQMKEDNDEHDNATNNESSYEFSTQNECNNQLSNQYADDKESELKEKLGKASTNSTAEISVNDDSEKNLSYAEDDEDNEDYDEMDDSESIDVDDDGLNSEDNLEHS